MFSLKSLVTKRGIDICARSAPIAIQCLSTKPVIQEEREGSTQVRKPRRVRKLKEFKEPFIKSLFCGKMDPQWLEYPEVLNNEELSSMKTYLDKLEDNLSGQAESHSRDLLGMLMGSDLLGLKVPETYDGLELTETENAMVHEVLAVNSSLSKIVSEIQDLSVSAITKFGSQQLSEKYLWGISKGQYIPCFGFLETGSISDPTNNFSTIAMLSPDGKSYIVNGKKRWVYNADSANIIITLAATAKVSQDGQRSQGLTAFVLDKSSNGLGVGKPYSKSALQGIQVCDVTFDNVVIPAENVLGELHEGHMVFENVLEASKFKQGSQCIVAMKQLISKATQYCIKTKKFRQPLVETDYALGCLGKMSCALYAVESMNYAFIGWSDNFDKPDLVLESLLVKVCASEAYQFVLKQYIQLVGQTSLLKEDKLETVMHNSHFYSVMEDTNDQLKLSVALFGLRHAGLHMNETVKKLRNPLMFPKYVFKRLYVANDIFDDTKVLKLGLEGYLHPTFQEYAAVLEYCVSRLYYSAERILTRHGDDVVKKELELLILGEMATHTFAIAACLARASRSYCIGLRDSDNEVTMASVCTYYFQEKIRRNSEMLCGGPYLIYEQHLKNIAERLFERKGYPAQHPTTRNF